MVDFDTNSQKALYFQGFSCIIELEQGEKSIRLKAVSLSFFVCQPAEIHMPEKKVQRIEKNTVCQYGVQSGRHLRPRQHLPAFPAAQYGYAGFCAYASGLPFAVLESS